MNPCSGTELNDHAYIKCMVVYRNLDVGAAYDAQHSNDIKMKIDSTNREIKKTLIYFYGFLICSKQKPSDRHLLDFDRARKWRTCV